MQKFYIRVLAISLTGLMVCANVNSVYAINWGELGIATRKLVKPTAKSTEELFFKSKESSHDIKIPPAAFLQPARLYNEKLKNNLGNPQTLNIDDTNNAITIGNSKNESNNQNVNKDYKIKFNYQVKKGAIYKLKASGRLSESMTISGSTKALEEKNTTVSGKLEGTITVTEVDDMNREKIISLRVSKCTMSKNDDRNETVALAKGTRVIVRLQDPDKMFLINNKKVSSNIKKLLELFFSPIDNNVTDDDIYGTKERKKIGDSWNVNRAMAAKVLSKDGVVIQEDSIKGSTKLENITTVNGKPCLYITGKFEANKINLPLPSDYLIDKTVLSGLFATELPVDTTTGSLSDNTYVSILVEGRGRPNASDANIAMIYKTTQALQRSFTYIKP